jgi:hypothetical protein
VAIIFSPVAPLEKAVPRVEEQASEYQGILPKF